MKTRIKNLGLGLVTVFLMLLSVTGYSQVCAGGNMTLTIKNVVQTSNTIEYDVYVMNSSASMPLLLSSVAGNVRYPAGMFVAGSTHTVVTQPSASGNFPNYPNLTMAPMVLASQQARWSQTPPVSPGPTIVELPVGEDKFFSRMRFTNGTATPWTVDYTSSLYWAVTAPQIGNVQVATYCNGNGNSGVHQLTANNLTLVNWPLPPTCTPFTSGSAVVTAPTCFGLSDGTAVVTLSPIPSSLSASYTLDGATTPVAVTLSAAGEFTISGLAAGAHTLSVTATCPGSGASVPFTINAGNQPPMPTVACYETATFNSTTCSWDVTGVMPTPPTVACYETATFNNTTCVYDVTGVMPTPPTVACYETATFNNTTCTYDVTGVMPTPPTVACYETATFNNTTCVYDVTGVMPTPPTVACYETATFNNTTCTYDVTGVMPTPPTVACYETATFNNTTCVYDVTGVMPTPPTVACYETATFNNTTCTYDVTGVMPTPPTVACYQTVGAFNNTTCQYDVTGVMPTAPTVGCYETATFNNTTCVYDVTGVMPTPPTVACYQTATFNNTTCTYDVTGVMPTAPTVACYETATFNNTTCTYDVTGVMPTPPTVACYQTATFNGTTCQYDVTGVMPTAPTVACYETATFNNTTCTYDVTGVMPTPPTVACYQTATFNGTTCQYDVTGVMPTAPTVACYQTATFNNTTCTYDVAGTMPVQPTLGACQAATFNNTTCVWDVTSTATTNGNITTSAVATYTWSSPFGTGLTYTTSGTYTSVIGCNTATLVLSIIPGGNTVNTFNIGTSCGATISNLSVTVTATPVSGATAYTFRVTNMTTNAVMIITRPVANFALGNYAGVTYGTGYQIEVSVNGGANYGTPCMLNTPSPITTIGASCGTTLTSMGQFMVATYVNTITGYRFKVTNVSTGVFVTYDAPGGLNKFNFNQLPASFRLPGTVYSVEVALRNTNGAYLPYGPACNVTTPGTAPAPQVPAKIVAGNSIAFTAIAYPNPFAENFMFDVQTSAEASIQIRVYDMLGKQIDNRNIDASEINNIQFGDTYPSGVYNVIVSQGENTKTLRVIKR